MPQIIRDFSAQGESADALIRRMRSGQAPHALLITGEPGTGKRTFATYLAALMLCGGEDERPCGRCASCIQIADGANPDLIVIEAGHPISPDVDSKRTTVPVEDIREMIRRTALRSLSGGYKAVVFPDASQMQPAAQNALLKILEEPPERVCFFLAASRREKILPTIVSRCRPFEMRLWDAGRIEKHLAESGVSAARAREIADAARGSIGRAIRMAADDDALKIRDEAMRVFFGISAESEAIRAANAWKGRKDESGAFLDAAEAMLSGLMRARFSDGEVRVSGAFPAQWREMAVSGGEKSFARMFDALNSARKKLDSNANIQAVFEELFICFLEEGRTCSKSLV